MLQTINLYVIYHTFICDKPMVYSKQTYGLYQTDLWFTSSKSMVYSKQTYGLHRLNQWFITYKPIVLTFLLSVYHFTINKYRLSRFLLWNKV